MPTKRTPRPRITTRTRGDGGDIMSYCHTDGCTARNLCITVKDYIAERDGKPHCSICRKPLTVYKLART